MKKKKNILRFIAFLLISSMSFTICFASASGNEKENKQFKVVGYYSGELFDEPDRKNCKQTN